MACIIASLAEPDGDDTKIIGKKVNALSPSFCYLFCFRNPVQNEAYPSARIIVFDEPLARPTN